MSLPTHVYYDLDVMNANSNAGQRQQMTFNETRDSPFLKSPENYYASVIRFYVETPSLPIFIPRCLIGQSDPNKLCYSVSMTYGGYTQQQYISYRYSIRHFATNANCSYNIARFINRILLHVFIPRRDVYAEPIFSILLHQSQFTSVIACWKCCTILRIRYSKSKIHFQLTNRCIHKRWKFIQSPSVFQ